MVYFHEHHKNIKCFSLKKEALVPPSIPLTINGISFKIVSCQWVLSVSIDGDLTTFICLKPEYGTKIWGHVVVLETA